VTRLKRILVSVHLDIVLISRKIGAWFAPNIARKSFWTHLMVLLGDDAQVDACLGLLGDTANLDARLVHVLRAHTAGSKLVLDTPDRTPR
jgi:hypothetical protein